MAKAKTKPPASGMTLAGLYGLVHKQHGESEGRLSLQASALSHIRDTGTANTNKIHALEEAICPRVAARLTELERHQKAINEAVVRAAMLNVKFEDRIAALEPKPTKPAPSEAELWNTTWTAATALSQEQLGRMIQSLQRVYWKKRLATEK